MRENHNPKDYIPLIENTPSSFLLNENDAKEYLLFLNRTDWNNLATVDIIDYEQLIYFELTYPENYEIQNLLNILKENICKNYIYKKKFLSRIIDKNIFQNDIPSHDKIYQTFFMDNINSINSAYTKF